MKFAEKYDNLISGILSGILIPLIAGLIIFAFTSHGRSIVSYLERIITGNIVTHAITLCVFFNISVFLLFNRLDMLRAARGVLSVTIVWAIVVFALKIL